MSNVGLFFFFFFSDLSQFLHVGFVLANKHCPVFFFVGLHFVFKKKTYAKNSVFLAASFGDLLLNEKQKKPFVSLNNNNEQQRQQRSPHAKIETYPKKKNSPTFDIRRLCPQPFNLFLSSHFFFSRLLWIINPCCLLVLLLYYYYYYYYY